MELEFAIVCLCDHGGFGSHASGRRARCPGHCPVRTGKASALGSEWSEEPGHHAPGRPRFFSLSSNRKKCSLGKEFHEPDLRRRGVECSKRNWGIGTKHSTLSSGLASAPSCSCLPTPLDDAKTSNRGLFLHSHTHSVLGQELL